MPQIVEDYQSASAQRPAESYAFTSGAVTLASARDNRLGIWISNGTPNSYCWIGLGGGSMKYGGFNVTPSTPFYTNLYIGQISANVGMNSLPLANAEVLYNGEFDTILLYLTFDQAHNISKLREDAQDPEGPPSPNEVRVFGSNSAFNINAAVYAVPDQYTLIMGAFAFTTVSSTDNNDGTWTIESDIPHRFGNDGDAYFIYNGGEFNITNIIDETHYTITGVSPITGTIWPAPTFVSGWAQDQQFVRIGVMEI